MSNTGPATTVTTQTVSGNNAFNSFSNFQVGTGSTVNLVLPGGTGNLINVVRNAPVAIGGTLNSLQNGTIGGNVYFADPYGFVVSKGGTVNVGSLAVSTPTPAFLDNVVGPQGQIGNEAVARLLAGTAPLSNTGNIVIRGEVNAPGGVSLSGTQVTIAGPVASAASANPTSHHKVFHSIVNTEGEQSLGGAVIDTNGDIELVARGDVRIRGTLDANAAPGQSAGTVAVSAGRNVKIGPRAVVSASGSGASSSGGTIAVMAGQNTTVAKGAQFLARGFTSGNGGTIDISAKGTETLNGGTFDVSPGRGGQAGSLLFDPGDMTINNAIYTNGTNAPFSASNSITFGPNADINTRQVAGCHPAPGCADNPSNLSTGNSGNITATAPTIVVDQGAQLLAFANNSGTTTYTGGTITLSSTAAGTSVANPGITVNGMLWGGGVSLTADTAITVQQNGVISTRYAASATDPTQLSTTRSGNISLKAPTITLNAGSELAAFGSTKAAAGGNITLDANSGSSGAIEVGGTVWGGSVSLTAGSSTQTSGGTLAQPDSITVAGTITIDGTAIIDTRTVQTAGDPTTVVSTGNSGNISLSASTINMPAGGTIVASANNNFNPGNITLTATSADTEIYGLANAATSITIQGATNGQGQVTQPALISGGDVQILGFSSGISSFDNTFGTPSSFGTAPAAIFDAGGELAAGQLLGLSANYLNGTSSATIAIGNGATIQANTDLTISAQSQAVAKDPLILSGANAVNSSFGASAVVGLVNSTASATVASGATLHAGDGLTIASQNIANLNVTALSASTSNGTVDITLALGAANIQATSSVATGAQISAGGAVQVSAINANSFSIAATALAAQNGAVSVADALAPFLTSTAQATFGASLNGSQQTSLLVEAVSDTSTDKVSAGSIVGTPILLSPFLSLGNAAVAAASSLFATPSNNYFTPTTTGNDTFRTAGAVALNLDDAQTASATIASTNSDSASPPTINIGGTVGVVAQVIDQGVRNIADSSVNAAITSDQASSTNAGATYANYTHNASATIGDGVRITAADIGVIAVTDMPLDDTWLSMFQNSGTTELADLLNHLNGNLGIANNITTSWADSTGVSGNNALAGAVNLFYVTNNATAWVGSNATLTLPQPGPSTPTNWTLNLAGLNQPLTLMPDTTDYSLAGTVVGVDSYSGPASLQSFANLAPVAVSATARTQTVDMAGNIGLGFGVTVVSGGTTPNALGGSFGYVQYDSTTIAGVGSGASINARGNAVSIAATTEDDAILVSPSAGGGASVAGNGTVAIFDNGDTTHASISNTADVTGANVSVTAEQDLALLTVAGAITLTNSVGVGVGVGVDLLTTNTEAYIGDNDADAPSADPQLGEFSSPVISAANLTVDAQTLGGANVYAVAGSAPSLQLDVKKSIQANLSSILTDLAGADLGLAAGFVSTAEEMQAAPSTPATPSFGLNLSGAATAISSALTTQASIEDSPGVRFSGPGALTVQALDYSMLSSGAGAAALNMTNNVAASGWTAGVAGAVAYFLGSDSTTATISNSTITGANTATVQALSNGEELAIAVDMAVNLSTGQSSNLSVGGSVSIGTIDDGTAASIADSTLTPSSSASNTSLLVSGYDTVDIGIGSGSLSLTAGSGGGSGVDAAVTVVNVRNYTGPGGITVDAAGASILGSTIKSYDSVIVTALNPSKIAAGGASGNGSSGDGDTGSFVFNTTSTTTAATIDADSAGTASKLTGVGAVTVNADSVDDVASDAILSNAFSTAKPGADSGIDFTGTVVGASLNAGGVIAVAGELTAGQSNVGVAYAQSTLNETHSATIGTATITASGAVKVTASDSDTFLDIAVGGGLGVSSSNQGGNALAGVGSGATTISNETTLAQIGTATITSQGLTVTATDTSTIRSGAGSIALSAAGAGAENGSDNAVGLSVVYNQISNTTQALVNGATLTVDGLVAIGASGTEKITAGAVAGAGSLANQDGVQLAGAVAINDITSTIEAALSNSNLNATAAPNALGTVAVLANDAATISGGEGDLAGSFSTGSSLAAGVGIGVNQINDIVYAHIDGTGTIDGTSITVSAASTPSISTFGFGVAITNSSFGATGSIATNILSDTVVAEIANGATVTAQDNVAVLASNTDTVETVAGSVGISLGSVGIGLAVAVNDLGGATTAQISGSTVAAEGNSPSDAVSVNQGTLATPIDLSSTAPQALSETTTPISGIAVDATSLQGTTINSGSAGFGADFAGGLNVGVSVLGGTTTAQIVSSTINPAGSNGQVYVNASSHTYAGSFILGAAGAGTAAAAAAFDVTTFYRSTIAAIQDSTVTADGAVQVLSTSSQNLAAIPIGAAGGGEAAIGGSVAVTELYADTEAYIANTGVSAGSVSVNADSTNAMNILVGALGASGGVAAGATFALTDDQSKTLAYIGDPSAGAISTTIFTDGDVSVAATSTTSLSSTVVSGGLAGDVGLAGMASVTNLNDTTQAGLINASIAGLTAGSGPGNVGVTATDTTTIVPYTGALGVGGTAGAGAGVNLIFMQDTVLAEAIGSEVGVDNPAASITISATSTRDFTPVTATAGIGGSAGIAGAYTAIYIGNVAGDGDLTAFDDSLGPTLTAINAAASTAPLSSTNGIISDTTTSDINNVTATSFSLTSSQGNSAVGTFTCATNDCTSSLVVASTLNAGTVSVTATANTAAEATTGAGAAGGGAGVGAGLAYTFIYSTVSAQIDPTSIVTTSAGLNVTATAQDDGTMPTADSASYFGAAGGLVALGGAIADAKVSDTVFAVIGGGGSETGGIGGAGPVTVKATDTSTISTATVDAELGGVGAAGASVALATKNSNVTAVISGLGFIGSNAGDPSAITVQATSSGEVSAAATAAAAGIGGAGVGAQTIATDTSTVVAELDATGSGTTIPDPGSITISATAKPEVSATSTGVGVAGGIGIGISLADAEATPMVAATIGQGAQFSGAGTLMVQAETELPGDGNPTAQATSTAAGGGIVIGAGGASATANTASTVSATIGSGVLIPDGDVGVMAAENSYQIANASANTGGFVAGGQIDSYATADTAATATIESGLITSGTRAGTLTIFASGTDQDNASSTAGAGGVIAGSGAFTFTGNTTGNTSDGPANGQSTATAQLLDDTGETTIVSGNLTIVAQQTTTIQPSADSTEGSVAGGNGTTATNTINSTATVIVGQSTPTNPSPLAVEAPNIMLSAVDSVQEPANGININVGAYGAGSGSSGGGSTVTNQTTNVTVGPSVALYIIGDFLNNPGMLSIAAANFLNTSDQISFSTGAGLAIAEVTDSLSSNLTNNVTIGAGAFLFTPGAIQIGSYISTNVNVNASISTYGLAGDAQGSATATVTGNQTVTIDPGAALLALGNITVSAGQSGDGGTANNFGVTATNTIYDNAAVPLVSPSAVATTTNNNTLTIASGALLDSASSISLGAYTGADTPTAAGTGNFSILGIDQVVTNNNPLVTDSALVNFSGTATAGLSHNVEQISIDANGNITSPPTNQFVVTVDPNYNPLNALTSEVAALEMIPNPTQFELGEIQTLMLLENGVSPFNVTAIIVSAPPPNDPNAGPLPLWASGGSVTFNADSINVGQGASLSAYGSPMITVTNASTDYLILPALTVLNPPNAGSVIFTGKVSASAAQQAGLAISQNPNGVGGSGNGTPTITISSTYQAAQGDSTFPGSVFLTGTINNPDGAVTLVSQSGSIAQYAQIDTTSLSVMVPSGDFAANVMGYVFEGVQAASEWLNAEVIPTVLTNQAVFPKNAFGSPVPPAVTAAAYSIFAPGWQATGGVNGPYPTFADYLENGLLKNAPVGLAGVQLFYNIDSYPNLPDTVIPNPPRGILSQSVSMTQANNNLNLLNLANPQSPLVVKNLIVNASIIDINGPITVGATDNASIVLPASLDQQIQNDSNTYSTEIHEFGGFGVPTNPTASPLFPLTGISTSSPGDQQITAAYNAQTNQIVLSDATVTGGGSVYLNGAIINSNPQGASINVASGMGTITVTNNTGIPVTLGNLATTSTSTSEVTIVDTNQTNGANSALPLVTWYLYNLPGNTPGTTSVYTNVGQTTAPATGWSPADYATLGALSLVASNGSKVVYSPKQSTAIQWVDTATLSRTLQPASNGDNGASIIDYQDNPGTAWSIAPAPSSGGLLAPGSGNSYSLTYSLGTINPGVAFQETISSSAASSVARHVDDNGVNANIYLNLPLTLTNVARADYPITINFTNSVPTVAVTSNASVTLGGTIDNPLGLTSIVATGAGSSILTTANGLIDSTMTVLQATNGIGTSSQPIVVSAPPNNLLISPTVNTFDASVNAFTTNGDIYLAGAPTLANPLPIGQVWSGWGFIGTPMPTDVPTAIGTAGIVSISAPNGLIGTAVGYYKQTASVPNIIGEEINLNGGAGGIGSASVDSDSGTTTYSPIGVNTIPSATPNGNPTGIVNATAAQSIYLAATADLAPAVTGDLRLGQVISTQGDVYLQAAGSIINAYETGSLSSPAQTRLTNDIALLNLTGNDGSATVIGFENAVTTNYQAFWNIANLALPNGNIFSPVTVAGTFIGYVVTTPNFSAGGPATPAAVQLFTAQTAADCGCTPTTAQVQNFVQFELSGLANTLDSELGQSNGKIATLPEFQTYQPNFSFTPSAATVQSLIAGSAWNPATLATQVQASALLPVSNTQFYAQPVNVSGANVTLIAGVGGSGSIGSSAPPVVFTLSNTAPQVTPQEGAAIIAAGPGDITITPAGNGRSTWTIAQENFVNVSASVGLTATIASGNGDVFLSSGGALNVNQITGNNIRINAQGDILNARGSGFTNISPAGNLDLQSGSGNIGSADAFLGISPGENGVLNQALAGGSIWIDQVPVTSLTVGNIFAGGSITLETTAGNILSEFSGDNTAHIQAASVEIDASAGIAISTAPLEITTPTLTLISSGPVYVDPFGPYTLSSSSSVPAGDLHIMSVISSNRTNQKSLQTNQQPVTSTTMASVTGNADDGTNVSSGDSAPVNSDAGEGTGSVDSDANEAIDF